MLRKRIREGDVRKEEGTGRERVLLGEGGKWREGGAARWGGKEGHVESCQVAVASLRRDWTPRPFPHLQVSDLISDGTTNGGLFAN
eukprot:scaffold155832_cov15-Tisochrysis_lutea.AAC.1